MDELLKSEILESLETEYSAPEAASFLAHLEQLFNEEMDPSDIDHFLIKITSQSRD